MSVKIRLTRIGRHGDPIYRLVVSDSRSPRDGKFIEQIGQYNPDLGFESFKVDEDRAVYWLKVGAIPSDTVRALFTSKGIMAKTAPAGKKPAKKVEKKEAKPAAAKKPAAEKKPAAKKTVKKEEPVAEEVK